MKAEIKISVLVTAKNYGKFLKECLESCLNQTVSPHEVIYCDDKSEDNSVQVARSVPGVKVIANKIWRGVVGARNVAVKRSSGNILVHVDGDDILPPDYLEKHLEVFDETTPFVYGASQAFGSQSCYWRVLPWKQRFIWNRNFVNTSCMMWKEAFLKAGGWKETCHSTMWDWSMAIRLSRLGTPRKSPATLLYRQHETSWSILKRSKGAGDKHIGIATDIRRELVQVSVGLIYSGRIPNFIYTWIKKLVEDVQILRNKPQLIIINNSEEILDLSAYTDSFSEIKIINERKKLQYKNETDRRNKVSELLATQYNTILENCTGDLVHLREDDIIPYIEGFTKLFNFLTESNPVKEAAAGLYFTRHKNRQKFVGGHYNYKEPRKTSSITTILAEEPFTVDFTGTGFLMFWKDLCPPIFEPFVDKIQAHDWAWGLALKKLGRQLWLLPDVICKHHTDEETYIVPPPDALKLPAATTFVKQETLAVPKILKRSIVKK